MACSLDEGTYGAATTQGAEDGKELADRSRRGGRAEVRAALDLSPESAANTTPPPPISREHSLCRRRPVGGYRRPGGGLDEEYPEPPPRTLGCFISSAATATKPKKSKQNPQSSHSNSISNSNSSSQSKSNTKSESASGDNASTDPVEKREARETTPDSSLAKGKGILVDAPATAAPPPPPPPPSPPPTEEDLKEQFAQFLRNFKRDYNTGPLYVAKRKLMRPLQKKSLDINFKDLMKDLTYVDLAVRIGNEQGEHSWLQPVLTKFLAEDEELKKDSNTYFLIFKNKPKSFKPVTSMLSLKLLVKKVIIYGGKTMVRAATSLGRHLFLCILLHILDNHKKKFSWKGSFVLKDIYIYQTASNGPLQCWIAKPPKKQEDIYFPDSCEPLEEVLDLQNLANMLIPFYKDGEVLPVFFVELKNDLDSLTSTQIETTWFPLYLEYHLALMSPSARRVLISELFLTMKTFGFSYERNPNYGHIFKRRPTHSSWRTTMKNSTIAVLSGVYAYKNAGDTKFRDTRDSLLTYERNVLEHTEGHLDSTMIDLDESELLLASHFASVLTALLKEILAVPEMPDDQMGKAWSTFTNLRSDSTDPGGAAEPWKSDS